MGEVEAVVNILGREIRVVGHDEDQCARNLHGTVREAALEYAIAALHDDAVVLDIGGNLGWMTIGFALALPHGHVVSVEPSPATYAYLNRNVTAARLRNVTTVNSAVSDSPGELQFFDCEWFSAGSFVKEPTLAAAVHDGSVTVTAETIDDIVERLELERIDLVKLDIEGHELRALRGARETLKRFRPAAVIEMNLFAATSFGNSLPLDFLAEICSVFPHVYDYRLDLGLFPILTEMDMYSRVQSQFLTGRPTDLICTFEPLPMRVQDSLIKAVDVPIAPEVRIAELEAELHRSSRAFEVEIEWTRAELARTREALAAASDELAALRASTSWRLTAPVRWLRDGMRRDRTPGG